MNIFERLGRWLTPYKYAFDEIEIKVPEEQSKKVNRKKKIKKNARPTLDETAQKELSDLLNRGEIGVNIVNINEVMTNETALERLIFSGSHNGYFIHTDSHHQLAIKFEKGSTWKYYERSNKRRSKLRPLIEYKEKGKSDKTHLIPVGFHGSENDERLLIDFDSTINRTELRKFEEYIGDVNAKEDVLWFIDIKRQCDESVIWDATVWDILGNVIKQASFHDKNQFRWR